MAVPQLKGATVLVTGAGSGIGRATAMAFAARGWPATSSGISAAALATVEKDVAALGAPCFAHVADVANEASMRAFADAVHARSGAVDVLVNNAGIGYLGPFTGTPLADWRRVLDINVMGVVHGCHLFLPWMLSAGGQRQIVNVASSAAVAPAPNMSAYAASKYAVLGLCDVLAMELSGTPIGVTAVCPGIVNTAITKGPKSEAISDEQLARLQAFYQKEGCTPEIVAPALVAAVRTGRETVLVVPFARPMYHVKRVSRALSRRLSLQSAVKIGFWATESSRPR